jgi:ribosome-binding factor A
VTRRQERIEEQLRRELSDVLASDRLRDPRVAHVAGLAITDVSVTPDLGRAHVFVDVGGDRAAEERVLAGLRAAAPLLRAHLGDRLALRKLPTLVFEIDASIARGARIERILAEVREPKPTDDER